VACIYSDTYVDPVDAHLFTSKGDRTGGVPEMKSLKAVIITRVAVMTVWAFVLVADSPAALYLEDTFDYAVGGLNGTNGGVGWSGQWSFAQAFNVSGTGTVEEGSLVFSNYPTVGNRARLANNSSANIGSPDRQYINLSRNAGVDILSGDLWMAYLFKRIDANGASDAWAELRNNNCFCLGMTAKAGTEFFSTSTNGLGIANRYDSTPSTPDESANIQDGNSYLLVGRFTNINTTSPARSGTIWALSAADYDVIKTSPITAAALDANHRLMSVDSAIAALPNRILINHIMRWVNGVKFSGAALDHYDPMIFDFDELRYGGSVEDVVLRPSGLAGDFNSDGKVDAGDYVIWRKNNGTNNALANDGGLGTPIGTAHYNLWRANFGNSPGAGSGANIGGSSAVPEPPSVFLVWIGLVLCSASSRSTLPDWRGIGHRAKQCTGLRTLP
jgi:hypothetical protein